MDLSIVSNDNLKKVRSFEVDTDRNWKVGDNLIKKTSDHSAFHTHIKLPSIQSNSRKSPLLISEILMGGKIIRIYLRIKLDIINKEILLESFGVSRQGSKRKKRKKRDSKQLKQLYQEQQQDLHVMLEEGDHLKV